MSLRFTKNVDRGSYVVSSFVVVVVAQVFQMSLDPAALRDPHIDLIFSFSGPPEREGETERETEREGPIAKPASRRGPA